MKTLDHRIPQRIPWRWTKKVTPFAAGIFAAILTIAACIWYVAMPLKDPLSKALLVCALLFVLSWVSAGIGLFVGLIRCFGDRRRATYLPILFCIAIALISIASMQILFRLYPLSLGNLH